jgi:hypothetical protein
MSKLMPDFRVRTSHYILDQGIILYDVPGNLATATNWG